MMNRSCFFAILVTLQLSVCLSCTPLQSVGNSGSSATVNAAPNNTEQSEAGSGKVATDQKIRKVDFKNFTYEPDCAGDEKTKVAVKNGEFSREKQEDGYVDRFYFEVREVSYGDLNGDNSEEAIVLTVCNTGGTGNFSQGFIYTLKDGKPALFATIPGGDRAYGGLRTMKVDNGQLVVESNDVGEQGGACCPEFIVTTRYDVSTGKLKQVGKTDRRGLYPTQRVNFPKGATGTTLTIKIPANEGKRFVVGAGAHQTLDVSINTDKASLRLLEDAELTENTKGFSAILPKNGDYTIEVANFEDKTIDVVLNIRIR
jgi:hypothetical protein